jgi:nucleotide-binding universal stress UspA family protein
VTSAVEYDSETGRVDHAAGFRSLVVALDLEATGDRALAVARALAERGGIGVELLTVSSPGVGEDVDTYELSRRGKANGWPADSCVVAHDNQPAKAIVEHVARRPGALLVMATSAKAPLAGHLLGSVSEAVLGVIDRPVLLVGPHVLDDFAIGEPTLIVCLDRTNAAEAAIPVVAAWDRTFGGTEPWVTEVLPRGEAARRGPDPSSHVRHFARQLRQLDVVASWGLLHGADPAGRLQGFANSLTDPFFVATSARLTDGRLHWRSTTRELIARSTRPVLVVPAK